MSATDPYETQEFNRAMHEKIIACGAVPLINDLFAARATNALFRQLLGLLCCNCDGDGGALYYSQTIIPGEAGEATIYAFGPVPQGGPQFGAAAFDNLNPAIPNPLAIAAAFTIVHPGPLVAAFNIPPAALTANGGWIDAVILAALANNQWGIAITTAAGGNPQPTVIPFTISFGGDLLHVGVLLLTPGVAEGGGEA